MLLMTFAADAAVVFELLGAVVDGYPGARADVLEVRGLVGVLEAAPTADVIDEDFREIGAPAFHVVNQAAQRVAAIQLQAAFTFVGVSSDD